MIFVFVLFKHSYQKTKWGMCLSLSFSWIVLQTLSDWGQRTGKKEIEKEKEADEGREIVFFLRNLDIRAQTQSPQDHPHPTPLQIELEETRCSATLAQENWTGPNQLKKTRLQIDLDMGSHQESAMKFPSCQNSSICIHLEHGGLRIPILYQTPVTSGENEWAIMNLILWC